MTVATEACGPTNFNWTGAEGSFPAGFSAQTVDAVLVTYTPALFLIPTTLQRDVHYSVTLAPNSNAVTIVPIALPAAPGTISILRRTASVQTTPFANLNKYDAKIHERLHDAAAMRSAEVRRDIRRAIKLSPASALTDLTIDDPGALNYLRWNAAGTRVESVPVVLPSGTYAVATESEAIDGFVSNTLMTPLRVTQAYNTRIGVTFSALQTSFNTLNQTVTTNLASINATAAAITAQVADLSTTGNRVFTTKAQIDASLNFADRQKGEVVADGANNGIYQKQGASGAGSWLKIAEPASVDQAITVTTYGLGYTLMANGRTYVTTRTDKNGVLLSGETAKGFRDISIDPRYYDSSHIQGVGQSVLAGSNAVDYGTPGVTVWNSRKFDIGTHTYNPAVFPTQPQNRPITAFAPLRPDTLTVANYGQSGATQANGICDYLKWSIAGSSANGLGGAPPSFLWSYVGLPGKQMHELSSLNQETHPSQPVEAQGPGGYWITMLNDVVRGKALSEERGETYGVLAFMWGQGFSNTGPFNSVLPSRFGAAIAHPAGAQWYAQQLISVVFTEMNSGIKAITGQTETIPMFMTPDPGITAVAQLWASDMNPNLHLVGPSYCYPSAVNVDVAFGNWGGSPHIAADGQVWRGQKSAEAIRYVIEERRQWKPLRMTGAREQADGSIIVDFYAPYAPINIDTVTLPKQAAPVPGGFASLYGLELIRVSDGGVHNIAAISIAGATSLRIVPATPLAAGALYTLQSAWQNAADTIGVVASVRTGPTLIGIGPFVGGVRSDLPTKEIVITGNIFAKLKSLSDIGAFTVSAAGGAQSALCRKVYVEGSNTILQLRNFETTGTFVAGQTVNAAMIDAFTNICDSDPAQSLYEWLDPQNYTARTGPFPMMNWLVQDIDVKVTRL